MRISDWSSDVCSSDLISRPLGQPGLAALPGGSPPMRVHDHGFPAYISSTSPAASRKAGRSGAQKRGFTARRHGKGALETKAEPMDSPRRPDEPRHAPNYTRIIEVQTGRASGREREGQ